MNAESRVLTLDPELVAAVRGQVETWNEELLEPWIPSPAAKGIAQSIRNSCPRMARALEAAGIFEPWSELLDDQIHDLARILRERGVIETANEAQSEARKALIPWCWEMQEEWLEANCLDYEPEADPDLYNPEEDSELTDEEWLEAIQASRRGRDEQMEKEDEHRIPLLRFEQGQSRLVQDKLAAAVQSALKNRNLSSKQVMNLGAFLWLVERLPEHHEKYTAQIEISWDYGDGAGWTTVTFSGDGLALDKGEIIRYEYGTDHPSKTVFRVSSISASDYDLDFDLEEWLRDFVNNAGDPDVKFAVEWHPENKMPASEKNSESVEPRYSADNVAWAIASLGFPDGSDLSPNAWEISDLVDSGKFGSWLKSKIEVSPGYESPDYEPDSVYASEAASVSAEDEWQATMTMETLTKKQQKSLQAQVDAEDLPSDISLTVSNLIPFGSSDSGNDREEEEPTEEDESQGELW